MRPFALAVLLLLVAPAPARSGQSAATAPAPDFGSARAAHPDFNLAFEWNVTDGNDELLIAAGNEGAHASLRLGPGRQAQAGSGEKGSGPLGAKGDGQLECVLKFRASAGRYLALVVGGREVLRAPLPEMAGPFKLAFAGHGALIKVKSYQKIDRAEPVLFSDDFTRQGAGLGDWKPSAAAEAWRINADPHPETSASPFALECAACGSPTMCAAGLEFWDDYRVKAAVSVRASPGAAGLTFNLREDGSGYLLRLTVAGYGSGGAGRAELVRLAGGGQEQVLAELPLAGAPRSWYELELAASGGSLRAWVDGSELAALSGLKDLVGGRVGLWSSGAAPARFDDVRVEALALSPDELAKGGPALDLAVRRWWLAPPALPPYFLTDRTMRSWARLEDDYRAAGGGYWHRARLAGEMEVAWKGAGERIAAGQLVLALAGDGEDFTSGYRLVADFGATGGEGGALLAIFEKDRRAAGQLVRSLGGGIEELAFSREAGQLVARSGARVLLAAPDTLKLPAGRAGARALGGCRIERRQLGASGANLLDEVFARAPVEWRAVTGDWEVASRWQCNPEFTWMLGRARRQLARLDLKRPVRGDFTLDLHFAVAMAERPTPFYDWPTNLTLALSSDPADPAAGYVFAFGGVDLPGRILRAGKAVAEGDALVRPHVRENTDLPGIHNHWFGVRVERRGARLALWGDGEKLGEFTDPEPLKGAECLALWTRGDNGATLARFRLEAEEPLGARRSPFVPEKQLPVPGGSAGGSWPFANRDGANGAMLALSSANKAVRLININAGGTFAAAYAPPGGIDLAREGHLSFLWRASPGAKVNLYLVRDGVFYRARLTGPAARPGGRYNLRHLGEVPGAAAGTAEFQHFSFDLGAALAAVIERDPEGRMALPIDEIRIGNYEVEDAALLEGFTGNKAGEWVEIAAWSLSAGGGKAPRLPGRKTAARSAPPRLVEPAPLDGDDFEHGLGAWESFGGPDGAQLARDDSKPAPNGGQWCLLGENQRCGGVMGALSRTRSFDVRRFPTLSFDYCLEPGTCVNVVFFTARGRHDLELTDAHGGSETLDRVAGAAADGRWRHADVDLDAALERSRGTPQIIRQLGLADLGPGSSTTATAWRIDNWMLLPAVNGARPVRFRWAAADESGLAGSSVILDRQPNTVPEEKVTAEKPELVQEAGLAEGAWYLHVRCRDQAGNWGASAHWRFKVFRSDDAAAPTVAEVKPAAGETACPAKVEIVFAEDGSGLCPHDIEVAINARRFRPGDDGVAFHPDQKRLTVDLADFSGRPAAPAGEVRVRVTAADYAGNRMDRPFEWTWKLDLSKDTAPPAAPRVIYLPSDRLCFEDFERGQGEFGDWRRAFSWREPARSRAETGLGRWHLASASLFPYAGNSETQIRPHPFDPERYSYVAFDYRLRNNASYNFMLEIENQHRLLGFSQRWGHSLDLGKLPEPVRDGAWHRFEFDFRKLGQRLPQKPDGHLAPVQKLLAQFETNEGADLDNFVIGSARGKNPEFIWGAPEAASGIAGYSWALSAQPDTVPAEKLTGPEPRAAFQDLTPGTWWFHVRARSGAGLWGETSHARIVLEKP